MGEKTKRGIIGGVGSNKSIHFTVAFHKPKGGEAEGEQKIMTAMETLFKLKISNWKNEGVSLSRGKGGKKNE